MSVCDNLTKGNFADKKTGEILMGSLKMTAFFNFQRTSKDVPMVGYCGGAKEPDTHGVINSHKNFAKSYSFYFANLWETNFMEVCCPVKTNWNRDVHSPSNFNEKSEW